MSVINEFLANNEAYAGKFTKGSLPMPPAKQIAVVVCMDARLETGALFWDFFYTHKLPQGYRSALTA